MRIALGVEYAGDAFLGWQSQAHGQTVQDALERALGGVAGHAVRLHCAGRTDAGVHATMQVVHFDTHVQRPMQAWVRGVNTFLPPAAAVVWAAAVDDAFHARYRACARRYRYVLLSAPVRPALLAGRVGWTHWPLSLAAMQAAIGVLRGRHDFSSFRATGCQAKSPVRTLHEAAASAQGPYVIFDFHGDGFLHHMVRNLVGALVEIGAGRRPPSWLAEVLAARDRRHGPPTFAAAGLYLCGVDYPPGWPLPGGGRIMRSPSLLLPP